MKGLNLFRNLTEYLVGYGMSNASHSKFIRLPGSEPQKPTSHSSKLSHSSDYSSSADGRGKQVYTLHRPLSVTLHVCRTTNLTRPQSPIPALLQPPCRSIPPNQSTLIASQLRKPSNPHSSHFLNCEAILHSSRVSRKNSSHVQQCIISSSLPPITHAVTCALYKLGGYPYHPSMIEEWQGWMDLLPGAVIRAECSGLTGGRSHERA